MAAQAIAGTGGLVKVSGTPDTVVGEVGEWDLTITRSSYDASALGSTWTKRVLGMGSWSGSLKGFYSVKSDTGQTLLQNALLNRTTLYVELMTENGTYSGLVLAKQIDIANPNDGIVTFNVSFDGTDELYFG